MKKIKIISFLLIVFIASSIMAGCSLFSVPATANKILNKYNQIATEYSNVDPVKSLFNEDQVFHITYKSGNFLQEINQTNSMFNLLKLEYNQILQASMAFFYEYKNSLNVDANNWDQDDLDLMYSQLLNLETAIEKFQIQKTAMESLTVLDEDPTSGFDYSYIIVNAFNHLKSSYNNLIKKAIAFTSAFEKSYIKIIAKPSGYSNLNSLNEAPDEVKRVAYSAQLYMAEAIYNYHIAYKGGFKVTNYQAVRDDMDLLNSLYYIKSSTDNTLESLWRSKNDDSTTLSYYKLTREREEHLLIERNIMKTAISQENKLKGKTDQEDLYNEYVNTINVIEDMYNDYASFVDTLISYVNVP